MPKIDNSEVMDLIKPRILPNENSSKPIVLNLNVAEIKELADLVQDASSGGEIWAIFGEYEGNDTFVLIGVNDGEYISLGTGGKLALERWIPRLTYADLNTNYTGSDNCERLVDFLKTEADFPSDTSCS